MSITNTKAKSVYNANGTTTEWNLGFTYDDTVSNVHIYIVDANDNETEVTSNYSIADGVLTYPTTASGLEPLAEGNKLVIVRDTPRTQDIELTSNGKLDGKVLEGGYDKLTLQVQELTEQVGRAIKVPISEEGLSQYKNPITEIREETKKSLDEIQSATDVVSSYTTESATNAATSKEEADRAVEASNISVMASSDAEAAAVMAENLSNEAKDAVSAYVNGLGAMRNSVIDLGLFESNQRRASSYIIDFDYEPLDVFIRFSDSERKMWIKGSHSFAGFEKIGDKKYKIFYSVSSEDFASQSAIKGPFYVQYVIKYSEFNGKPVTYRGRVDTVDQLPETAQDGDLWYVGPIEQSNKEEYIWQEGKWELLGSTDFSSVYSKEEIDNKVSVIENSIETAVANRVSKAGDTMTGALKMSDKNEIRFGTDDNFYYIRRDSNNGNFIIYANNNRGLYLVSNEQHTPYYWNGTKGYRLLTTADLEKIDYVVESQVNSDGSWYRKYKSGWLEQGGVTPALEIPLTPSSDVATVTFLKPFSKLYSCHVSPSSWASSVVMDFGSPLSATASNNIWARSITNSVITVDKGVQAIWYAAGQGA